MKINGYNAYNGYTGYYSEGYKRSLYKKIDSVINQNELSKGPAKCVNRTLVLTKDLKHVGMDIKIDPTEENNNTTTLITVEIKQIKNLNDKRQ